MNTTVQSNVLVLNRDRQERAVTSCAACARRTMCPASGNSTQLVIKAGKTACAARDKFAYIYVVRSGFFKSYTIDDDGTMQITGFYLPGECFGMDGIARGEHSEYVEALDTSSVCRISAEALSPDAVDDGSYKNLSPHLMVSLMRLMSNTIGRDHKWFFNLGKMSARQRFSNFLLDFSDRMAQSGYSDKAFRLCMSRTDIANYLCLALETVSRLFTQLHAEGAIAVDRRDVKILDKQLLLEDESTKDNICARAQYRKQA